MAFGGRLVGRRERRAARSRGFEAALGLAEEPPPVRAVRSSAELRCVRCGEPGRLETLDLRTSRGLARCGTCDHGWAIIYQR